VKKGVKLYSGSIAPADPFYAQCRARERSAKTCSGVLRDRMSAFGVKRISAGSVHQEAGRYLGTVEAPSETAAEAAAVAAFDLSDEQRRRLIVSEGN
jgi:hypothetical protein